MTDPTPGQPDEHGLLDLDHVRAHVRQSAAAEDGDPIAEATRTLARKLAAHLALRPGRDLESTADALLDAGSCLGALVVESGAYRTNPGAVVLLNIMGTAALELDRIRAEASA